MRETSKRQSFTNLGVVRLGARLVCGASLAAVAAGAAAAADSSSSSTKVQEVIVTANRSSAMSVQKLAMAVSAVSQDTLDKAGQASFLDLTRFAPSLNVTQDAPGFNKFDMRGLTNGAYRTSDTSDRSLVAVYLDDTPISVQGQTPDLKVYDLERVEVLRGPQGTLYGAGSMAGTVRFITAKPNSNSFFGTAEGSVSDTEHGGVNDSFRGMINLPVIADQLAVRLNFYQAEDSGFINDIGLRNKKDVNLDRTTQARVAIRWTPNARFTADFSATYEKSHAYGLDSGFSGLGDYTISTNGPEGTRDDFSLYNLNLQYDLGFADLISSTSYTWRRIGFQANPSAEIGYFFQDYGSGKPVSSTTYPLFEAPTTYSQTIADEIPQEDYDISQKVQDVMQEARLVSKSGGPVTWTVGAFYEHQKRKLYQDIPTPGFDSLSYMNYFYGPFNTPNGLYNSQTVDDAFEPNDIFSGLQNTTEYQFALFTDDTWHVTSKLDLTAGVRWFDFHENYYLFESGVYGVINHVPLTENAALSSNGFNPRFNASYRFNDDIMLYAEAAKGFRYGGANQPVPLGTAGVAGQCTQNLATYGLTSAPLTFGPDHLWSYTVGEKSRLAGGRLILNADAYYIDWSDVQTRLLLNCSYFFTENAGTVHSQGVELETTFKVTPEITVSANGAYNDARAAGDIPTVGAQSGDLTPYFPRWMASVTAYYDRQVGQGTLHAQASYSFRGDQHTTFNPNATTFTDGQLVVTGPSATYAVIPSQVDVGAALAYDIGRYEVGLFGNNLTDGTKVTDIARATYYAVYQAGARITYARPRTVGVRLKVKF